MKIFLKLTRSQCKSKIYTVNFFELKINDKFQIFSKKFDQISKKCGLKFRTVLK